MRPRSFSFKLSLALLLPAIAALTVVGLLLGQLLVRLLQQSAADSLLESLTVLRPLIATFLDEPPVEIQRRVTRLTDEDGLRITIVGEDGTVVADSSRTWEQVLAMDDHSDRPELRLAAAEGSGQAVRQSSTLRIPFLYSATQVRSPRGRGFLLRLARPTATLRELRGSLATNLLLATAAAVVLVAVLSWGLHRRLLRPISELITDADRMMSGEPGRRVAVPTDPELAPLARSFNRLAERVESQVADLEAERKHQLAIVASMSEGVLVTDRGGKAVLANPAWRELFGISGRLEGSTAMELTSQAKLDRLITETQSGGKSLQEEIEIPTPTARTVILTSSALSGGLGVVVVARDMTAFLRLSEIRRDFVANVSHELKTPLSAIRAMAETLQDGALDDPEAAPRFTRRILVQCRRLEALLSDLLTLSRLEHVAEGAELARVDPRTILERAVDGLAEMAQEKQITLATDLRPVPSILGDPEALERLCLNLLENAIKYNRAGGRVDIRLSGDDREIALEVADTGIGIPPDSLDRLFERFYRVDKGRSREEGGTGLGLAIVKHAAQLHGGRVEVSSRLGKGTAFRVLLPARAQDPPDARRPPGRNGMSRAARVLVLCTGNSCRSQIAEAFLRRHGGGRFEVWSAGSDPAATIHPMTHEVMQERGYPLEGQEPKNYRDLVEKVSFDYVIIVCDGAARSCPAWPGATRRLLWPFDDPAAIQGSEAEKIAGFRRVRDEIEARVLGWISNWPAPLPLGGEPAADFLE